MERMFGGTRLESQKPCEHVPRALQGEKAKRKNKIEPRAPIGGRKAAAGSQLKATIQLR